MSAAESAPPAPAKTGRPVLWQILALLLCAGGLALSLHLLHRGLILKNSQLPDTIDPCRKVFNVGCDDTLRSERAEVFGVPIAGWGVMYFAGAGSLLILSLALSEAFCREAMAAGLLLTVCGAVGALGLASLMALGKAPVCPSCLVVHVLCLALVPLFKLSYGGTFWQWSGNLLAGAKYLSGRKAANPAESAWKAIGFVNVVLVMAMAFVWVNAAEKAAVENERTSSKDQRQRTSEQKTFELVKKFDETKPITIPVDDDDPRIGPATAPAQIVVFSTFRCRGCRGVALALENLRKQFGDSLSIVYKYQTYGDETCPLEQPESKATPSCRANWAAEAAHQQGKFWEYHDALFAAGFDCEEKSLVAAAQSVGLDMPRFERDRRSADIRRRVELHLALGTALHVSVTPTVILNGKQITELGQQQFVVLVAHALSGSKSKELPEGDPKGPQHGAAK